MKPQPKFVTKLFAAIDGYAGLKAQSEKQALDLSHSAREKIKPLIEQYNGVWIYEKDGEIFANFKLPEDAVNAAVAIQQTLKSEPGMKLRIGIHTGDIKNGAGAGDIVASGIAELTVPGGVCISDKVYAVVKNKVDVKGEFLEETRIEGVDLSIRVYALVGEGLVESKASASAEGQTQRVKTKPSIAVLPFVDMSPEKDQEWFCDGVADEIINAMSHIEDLHVVARTSAFSFKGKDVDIREIGHKLNVETVLEGSIRKAGNRIRITSQLIKIEDGYHLWSEKYDRDLEDIFAIQDEISLAIVEALKVKLLKKEKVAVVKRHTGNPEAYELYLKGRYFWNKRSEDGLKKGIQLFQQAIEKEPLFARAYSGIADCYINLGAYYVNPEETRPKMKQAIEKALEIDGKFAEAHATLGFIKLNYDWDWHSAEREFERAIELNPNYATAYEWYGMYLGAMGKLEDAIIETKRALELDPLSLVINTISGDSFYCARRYDEAIEQYHKTLEMDPNYEMALLRLGFTYTAKAMYEEAIAALQKLVILSGDIPFAIGFLGYAYALSGQKNEALKMLDRLNDISKERYVSPFFIAIIHIGLGDTNQTFEYLEKAYEVRDAWMPYFKSYHFFENLYSDPRLKTLLKKMNLPVE